jgi:cell division control protein 7
MSCACSGECSHALEHNIHLHIMSKPRASLRNMEHIDVHEDDLKGEDAEERLDESMDPLDESGHTVDSSDEEVEHSVQEDMARFEESFVGITKRFRLINRIGEGMSQTIGVSYAGQRGGSHV